MKIDYMNSDQVNEARQGFPDLQKAYPENRNVWTLVWEVRTPDGTWLSLRQVIDDETGSIINEGAVTN